MKIDNPTNTDVQNIAGDFGSTQASISSDSFAYLFRLLSSGFYSNPIGSICREIASNCFDSHIEAKVDDPVVISRLRDNEGEYISFKDVGVGLSPMRMLKVYMRYFKSTKRKTNDFIGGFGLGSKTPMSYTNYFYIVTHKNSKKYEYLYSKGEELPTLDCLTGSEERVIAGNLYHKNIDGIDLPVVPPWKVNWPLGDDITERNGSEIKIYIKSGDYGYFLMELKKQLCYFENVWFINFGIDNEYKIYENDLYKFRNQDQYSDEMHICLGKVSYPINWETLDLERIMIPVGVKFKIGELKVTPNRESLIYTDEIKELVLDRIKKTMNSLINQFKENAKPIKNFKEWYALRKSKPFIKFGEDDKLYLIGVKEVEKRYKCDIFRKVPTFNKIENHIDQLFEAVVQISGGKQERHCRLGRTYLTEHLVENISKSFSIIEKINTSGIKNAYFRNGFLLKKRIGDDFKKAFKAGCKSGIKWRPDTTFHNQIYFGSNLAYFNLGIARKTYAIIKVLRANFIRDCCKDYDNVPDSFVQDYKARQKLNNASLQRKLAGKVFVKSVRTYTEFEISFRQIELYTGIIIYGGRDDRDALRKASIFMNNFKSFNEKKAKVVKKYKKRKPILDTARGFITNYRHIPFNQAYEILIVAKQFHKYFDGKTMVHVDNLYSDNELFRRLASAIKIEEFFKDIMREYKAYKKAEYIKVIDSINSTTGELLSILKRYVDENFANQQASESIISAVKDLAEKNNLYDPVIESTFEKVKLWYDGLDLIKFVNLNKYSFPFVLKYIKEQGKNINKEYYLKYIVSQAKEVSENEGQIIMLFPEERAVEEEQPVSKFKVLTRQLA